MTGSTTVVRLTQGGRNPMHCAVRSEAFPGTLFADARGA